MNKTPLDLTSDEIVGRAEQFKAMMDQLKHLATLSTGLILILFAFLQNFVKQAVGRQWERASVLFLLFGVAAGVIAFTVLAVRLPRKSAKNLSAIEGNLLAGALIVAWACFFSGLFCLGVFFEYNA